MSSSREKLVRILRANSPLTEAEIEAISDTDGWAWVYRISGPKLKDCALEICFTGFAKAECDEVTAIANEAGFLRVKDSVTKALAFLVVGASPGPSKLEKAKRQNVSILDRRQFDAMVADGVIPAASGAK